MFDTVLIANRGEIAVRIIATLRRLGVRSVAVFSDADADARHVREADMAVHLGPTPARESYLHTGRVLDAARASGAQAVHPGYGFLSENAAFARACADAGIVFVGPSPHAIDVMGDKIRAKLAVGAAGVAVVPGRAEPGMTDADLVEAAADVGYPVLVKPSAGGGGKGMRQVDGPDGLAAALVSARREASASFGDDTLFVERFVARPRHIEVQVLADTAGTTIHLGERECSLQRRHQKIIEEAPSALLDEVTRRRICSSAVSVARSVDYSGVGTVEFIVGADRPEDYFFMEMNTRLQVEHPVTELVTGLDLVEQQLLVASGRPLGLTQDDVVLTGHAVEARLYAEDPARGFLPTGGRALVVTEPEGEGVRVDSGLTAGGDVGTTYDPMLAKIIAWGPDRPSAIARLDAALARTTVLGFATNLTFLRALLADPDVRAGRLDTGLVGRISDAWVSEPIGDIVYAAFALKRLADTWPIGDTVDLWDVPSGWRPRGATPITLRPLGPDGAPITVTVRGKPTQAWVRVGDQGERAAALHGGIDGAGPGRSHHTLTLDGSARPVTIAEDGATTWISIDGASWPVAEASLSRRGRASAAAGTEIRSPMPGTVIAVPVGNGDLVEAGAVVVVVEAMKMEHSLTAPGPGTVELLVGAGDRVALDEVLARLVAPETTDTAPTDAAPSDTAPTETAPTDTTPTRKD